MAEKTYLTPTKWLPSDHKIIQNWVKGLWVEVHKDDILVGQFKKLVELHMKHEVEEEEIKMVGLTPPVEDLFKLIMKDSQIYMLFNQMFCQQFQLPAAQGNIAVQTWPEFIFLLNQIMTYTPVYSHSATVGFPINALINWPMQTEAGFACFLNKDVNKKIKTVLIKWGNYLKSPKSASVLNTGPHGWFCEDALRQMIGPYGLTFEQQFICFPEQPHWGFNSWDAFFTREFKEKARPLPEDDDKYVIVNACEAAPFKIVRNVDAKSLFWIKNQPYSIDFMLNHNKLAKQFYGGTVYQGFLSAFSYHRWNSPISGTILKVDLIDGFFYTASSDINDDPSAPNMSQGYCSQISPRAVIYISADNKDIGILCFVAIGMSEVSSTEVTVKEDQRVEKGDQLGMFHFGGSSHCVLYPPYLNVEFDISPNKKPSLDAKNIPLRRKIARVTRVKDENCL